MSDVRWARILVLLVVGATCLWRLDAAPLQETDEGFTANRAASLLRNHAFLLTRDDVDEAGPQFNKPPLAYWPVALGYQVFGAQSLWAVRLPTALAAILFCLLLFQIHLRAFGPWIALAATLFFAGVPFALMHMRAAHLEMSLLLPAFAATALFGWRKGPLAAATTGLLVGSAFLVKGLAGLLTLAPVLAFGLCVRPRNRELLRDALLALATSAILPACYLFALPAAHRPAAIHAFFIQEGHERLSLQDAGVRLRFQALVFFSSLRWHLVGAALALVLGRTAWRQPRVREWVWLLLALGAPVLVIALLAHFPYPRYLLPLYPFVVALSACFCVQAPCSRANARWLIPFAVAAWFVDSSGWRWLPPATALAVWAATHSPALAARAGFRAAAALALLLAVGIPSAWSPATQRALSVDQWRNHPELIPLAREAACVAPAGEPLIVGEGVRQLRTLFYSQRPLLTVRYWLRRQFQPGAVRYGIFLLQDLEGVPYVRETVLRTEGAYRLSRIEIDPSATQVEGLEVGFRTRTMRNAEAVGLQGRAPDFEPRVQVIPKADAPQPRGSEDASVDGNGP